MAAWSQAGNNRRLFLRPISPIFTGFKASGLAAFFHHWRRRDTAPPCPKATGVYVRLASISCKQQREQRFFNPPSNICYCGSRVFNTLVGSGVKLQRILFSVLFHSLEYASYDCLTKSKHHNEKTYAFFSRSPFSEGGIGKPLFGRQRAVSSIKSAFSIQILLQTRR